MRLLVIASVWIGTLVLPSSAVGQAGAGGKSEKDKKDYRIIDERKIPNGGLSRVIVIDSAQATESAMRELGDKLREDTKRDRNAFVSIYDDEKAARMRKDSLAERLGKKDQSFHDKHMVGAYTRNGNTGSHELIIFLEGLDGSAIKVKY